MEMINRTISASEKNTLQEAFAILERQAIYSADAPSLSDPTTAGDLVKLKLGGNYEQEVFLTLYLDNQHRLISAEESFKGSVDSCNVYPRMIVKRALEHNAAAVIFAHNHPSGIPEPSQADIRITDRLKSALLLVDVRVLDHIVVSNNETVSLAKRGLI